MRIEFDSLTDLDNFFQWVAKRGAPAMVHLSVDTKKLTELVDEAAAEIVLVPEVEAPESDRDLSGHPVAETAVAEAEAEAKPARKRRTKAEMEAARAAESGNGQAGAGETSTGAATTGSTDGAEDTAATTQGNPFAQQELPANAKFAATSAPVERGELTEFLAARLAERPEVSQIEHLNLARAFIGKHGMPKYNESFALVGLSSNVMTFGPTECAKHAAVLDFLASE